MIVIPCAPSRRPTILAWLRRSALPAAALACALVTACSNTTGLPITGNVGISNGVSLITPNTVTQIQEGNSIPIHASVLADPTGAGVTWSISGAGTLTNETSTTATFVGATSVTGAVSALVTATSIANPNDYATVTLITLGSPQINTEALFPANQGVAYGADVSVEGGLGPYTWTVASGALPKGIGLGSTSSGIETIVGTPSEQGAFPFTLKVTDNRGRVATSDFSLTVNPQHACLLQGNFVFLVSGFRSGSASTHAGIISIDSNGNITGEQDYKDRTRTTPDETLETTSHCKNRQTNSGVLILNSATGTYQYNFSATQPDSSGVIHSARLQLINAGSDAGSGQLVLQDTSALTGAPPSGNFAFGLLGVDPQQAHFGFIGQLTSDTAGNITAGSVDANGSSPLSDAALTGTLSTPDSLGRGVATFTAGGATSTYAYYMVDANRMYLLDIDPAGTARTTGRITRQSGSFDNTALASPAIISLWGKIGSTEPVGVLSLGRLSNANPTAGTIDAVLDTSDQSTAIADQKFSGQSYSVSSSGRGTLTLANGSGSASYVFDLDGPGSGYLLETGSSAGSSGLLEPQIPVNTTSGSPPFSDTLSGFFVDGTQYPQSSGPISLVPLVNLNFGQLSANSETGEFAIDTSTGRGQGQLQETGVPLLESVLYIVSPTKIDLLRFPGSHVTTDGSIEWLIQ